MVEKILLARRIKGEQAATARHVKDRFDLILPDRDRFDHLFRTALVGQALAANRQQPGLEQQGHQLVSGVGGRGAPRTRCQAGDAGA